MSIPLLTSKSSASGISVKSRTPLARVCVYDDPDSGMSIQTLSPASVLDRSLCQDPTYWTEFEATSESTYTSTPPTRDASQNSAAPVSKPAAVTLFAPTARQLDAAPCPHTPFLRPDTPHPRLRRPSTDGRPVAEQTPSVVPQKTKPSITYSESHHSDSRREDFKHAMFLAWLDRR